MFIHKWRLTIYIYIVLTYKWRFNFSDTISTHWFELCTWMYFNRTYLRCILFTHACVFMIAFIIVTVHCQKWLKYRWSIIDPSSFHMQFLSPRQADLTNWFCNGHVTYMPIVIQNDKYVIYVCVWKICWIDKSIHFEHITSKLLTKNIYIFMFPWCRCLIITFIFQVRLELQILSWIQVGCEIQW